MPAWDCFNLIKIIDNVCSRFLGGCFMPVCTVSLPAPMLLCHCQEALIKAHDAKYNPHGIKRGAEEIQSAETPEPEKKKLCVDKSQPLTDESLIEDKPLSCIYILESEGSKTHGGNNLVGYNASNVH